MAKVKGIRISAWRPLALGLTALAVIAVALSLALAWHHFNAYALTPAPLAGVFACFVLLLVLALAPGFPSIREPLSRWLPSIPALGIILIWCAPYLIYAAGTRDFRWSAVLRLMVFAAPLLALYRWLPVRAPSSFCWQDAVTAILLIAYVLGRELKGVWNVPANLDFMTRLFVIVVSAWCLLFVRGLPGFRYDFVISGKTLPAAGLNFLYFAAIALPAGFALHFIRWNPRWKGPADFAFAYLEIFLFIALLEEMFFRGFLQNLISNSLHSSIRGQLIVSCLFGLFHILHAPFPNWRYVALAAVAGWFYGSAYRSGGILSSALTHATVDTLWRTFFSAS